jgi:hypothetical protein
MVVLLAMRSIPLKACGVRRTAETQQDEGTMEERNYLDARSYPPRVVFGIVLFSWEEAVWYVEISESQRFAQP